MKTAFVSGASGGIGYSVVKKFIENGYFVCAQYNNGEEDIKRLTAELESQGLAGYLFAVKADFNSSNSVKLAIEKALSAFSHIDVLVNNAGIDVYKLITDTTEDDFDSVFNVNVKSAYALSKAFLPKMIEKKSGKIINVSSIWGISGACMETIYSASKGALISFTKALAKEVAPSGITVNCVCPGVIDTKMNACFTEEEKREIIASTPLNRLGTPDEVAELIYFLASSKADFITGQIVTCDGGFIL